MMSQSSQRATVPDTLRSPRAKLVYLYLSTHGEATVAELQESLAMTKLTLYSILRTLQGEGLVGRDASSDRYSLV
ncbi:MULTISPECIES: helix-turn-helix domain-containing protein [Haloprofundus]|uniref:helix-turn-helix domain-containing protein n=1 Tax=Haloprofundus TaxID=1911573 RepID=UPI000E4415C4|nr:MULTISPECIES: helix-turn-helix domain-containing protein [Haloprofundus]QCJ46483.1 TrmB family transcriptional regulator [Haloprofundus sp. MHR1]